MRRIIFGIRKSALARRQLDEFMESLVSHNIKLDYEIKTITTSGDKDQTSPVAEMGQGIFTKEIERALLDKEIDCAVHSLKDMPVKTKEGTALSFCLPRQDPRDCLVVKRGLNAESLRGLRVGTGSPRRSAFLKEMEPEIKFLPIRGNVDTRIRKLDQGDYDAIVLAACGLERLGLHSRIHTYLDPETFVPAAGQGIVCSQTRSDDVEINTALKQCASLMTEQTARAERKVLEALEVGCQMPFGVYARFDGERFFITAKIYVEDRKIYVSKQRTSSAADWPKATEELIQDMKMARN